MVKYVVTLYRMLSHCWLASNNNNCNLAGRSSREWRRNQWCSDETLPFLLWWCESVPLYGLVPLMISHWRDYGTWCIYGGTVSRRELIIHKSTYVIHMSHCITLFLWQNGSWLCNRVGELPSIKTRSLLFFEHSLSHVLPLVVQTKWQAPDHKT